MEFETLVDRERRNTDSVKWDGMGEKFSSADLDAFWVADMDFQAPECARRAVAAWAEAGLYGYYRVPEDYWQAFIDWEARRHGLRVEREWLRFSPGVVTGLYWAVSALSAPGDAVAVMKPVYYPFFGAVEDTGRTLVSCDLVNTGGRYTVDFGALERTLDESGARLMILSSPHNPVGRVYERWELERICGICEERDIILLSDEIHQDLVYAPHTHVPTLSVGRGRVVTFTSASKTFNLAGLQNSFLILPDEPLRAAFDGYLARTTHGSGAGPAGCIAARAAYRGGEAWLNSLRRQVRGNFETVRDILLDQAPGVRVSELEGTYLMWLDLRAYVDTPEAVRALMEDRCRIAADYGAWFGGERFAGFVRLNLATDAVRCRAAALRLAQALAAL